MSEYGGYCPNCENYITAPLLPLDYHKCNTCMMSIHSEDLLRKRSMTLGVGAPYRAFSLTKIGTATLYDAAQVADTINVNASFDENDWLFVAVSTCGANQNPNSVTAGGIVLTQVTANGSQSHVRTTTYYGKATTSGSGVSVFWTGQHPSAAVIAVYKSPAVGNTVIVGSSSAASVSQYTSSTPGTTLSPTPSNCCALCVVGVENGQGTILTSPTGFTLSDEGYTGQGQQPIDCSQNCYVLDIPVSTTISSVVTLSGANNSNVAMLLIGKP